MSKNKNDPKTLWIGDLESYMDETFIRRIFYQERELTGVKIIRDRNTGLPAGYGFIDFASNAAAKRVLDTYSGKPIAGLPGHIYRLNWATFSVGGERKPDPVPQFSCFVGDLAPEVTDFMLFAGFQQHFPTVKSAKVVVDPITGQSKGYGFVRFATEEDKQRAMVEMQGLFVGTRPIKIAHATPKNKLQEQQQYDSSDGGYTAQMFQNEQKAQYVTYDGHNDPNNTTIYIGNIDDAMSQQEIGQYFAPYGNIVSIKIPQGKRCAFVQYSNRKEAEKALAEMNGQTIGMNKIKISWGRTTVKITPNMANSATTSTTTQSNEATLQQQQQYYHQLYLQQTLSMLQQYYFAVSSGFPIPDYFVSYFQQPPLTKELPTDYFTRKFDISYDNNEYIKEHENSSYFLDFDSDFIAPSS